MPTSALVAGVALAAILSSCSTAEPGARPAPETGMDAAQPQDPTQQQLPEPDKAVLADAPRVDTRAVVLAVGDIACAPGSATTETRCRQDEVANLVTSLDHEAVLGLGDLQYERGTRRAFNRSFDVAWGATKDKLWAVPGNHEYRTSGASGYKDYLGETPTTTSPTYYKRTIGAWTAYAVDSNCDRIDCGPQVAWLREQLASDTSCSLMFMHHPRYSTGEHGPQNLARRFFRIAFRNGVELVLSGHDHHYERFAPMNAKGQVRPKVGTVQFVSGAGGKSHYTATGDAPGSRAVVDDVFGVLRLALLDGRWRSSFRGVDGTTRDAASGTCR